MKILIVDDNCDLADGLADVLQADGHHVAVENSAQRARVRFSTDKFDFVVLDMKLPDGSGLQLFYEFHTESPDTRILIMTGFRLDQLLQQLVRDGAVGVLRKPFAMDQVLDALRKSEPEGIVLIADDDPDFGESLSRFLAESGRKPLLARDGCQAVEMTMTNSVDVLVLDLKLPVLCGAEVYLRLKEKGKVVPTIMVTGYSAEEADTIDEFRAMSITNCLFKPFNPEELLTAIDRLSPNVKGVAL